MKQATLHSWKKRSGEELQKEEANRPAKLQRRNDTPTDNKEEISNKDEKIIDIQEQKESKPNPKSTKQKLKILIRCEHPSSISCAGSHSKSHRPHSAEWNNLSKADKDTILNLKVRWTFPGKLLHNGKKDGKKGEYYHNPSRSCTSSNGDEMLLKYVPENIPPCNNCWKFGDLPQNAKLRHREKLNTGNKKRAHLFWETVEVEPEEVKEKINRTELVKDNKNFCHICKEIKPIMEFDKNITRKDGVAAECKECRQKRHADRTIKNKERTQEEIDFEQKRLYGNTDMKKKCARCQEWKSINNEWGISVIEPDGLNMHCKACAAKITDEQRDKKRKLSNEFKKDGCIKCGEKDVRCLDAAHINRSDKLRDEKTGRTISPGWITNLEKYAAELKKCKCLCANCHIIETQEENWKGSSVPPRSFYFGFSSDVHAEKEKRSECKICKVKVDKIARNYCMFDFDHRDPSAKLNHVAMMLRSPNKYPLEIIKAEMEKCDLLCRNCHRKKTIADREDVFVEEELDN